MAGILRIQTSFLLIRYTVLSLRCDDGMQNEELHVTQWCKDNNSCLFLVADHTDQSSAEIAVTAIVDKAMLYAKQKAKPV